MSLSANELQRTAVLIRPDVPASVLQAVKAVADQHDFVLLDEQRRTLSAAEAKELGDIGLSREFAAGACTLLLLERLDGTAVWQQACADASIDEAGGVFSALPEHSVRAVAALYPLPLPVQRTFAMIKPDAVRTFAYTRALGMLLF